MHTMRFSATSAVVCVVVVAGGVALPSAVPAAPASDRSSPAPSRVGTLCASNRIMLKLADQDRAL